MDSEEQCGISCKGTIKNILGNKEDFEIFLRNTGLQTPWGSQNWPNNAVE